MVEVALATTLLHPYNKKVSTPSTDTYIKINTSKIPSGPIVAGFVVSKSIASNTIAPAILIATILPNILSLYHLFKTRKLE